MSATLMPFLNLLFKFKNKLPVLSRVKLPYLRDEQQCEFTKNYKRIKKLKRPQRKCTVCGCLLATNSVGVSPCLLTCTSAFPGACLPAPSPRCTFISRISLQHAPTANRAPTLCKFLFYLFVEYVYELEIYQIYQGIEVSAN